MKTKGKIIIITVVLIILFSLGIHAKLKEKTISFSVEKIDRG